MTSLLTSTANAAPSLTDTLPYLQGMLLVLVILSTLWGICAICAKVVAIISPPDDAPAGPVARPTGIPAIATSSQPSGPERIAPQIVAVIAAAVANTVGRSGRIISITQQNSAWAKAGRQSILSSHRIR